MYTFKKDFISLFLERGGGSKREKHQCAVASHTPPTGDRACNPGGMCPDWESTGDLWFTGWTQSAEPHQPGQKMYTFLIRIFLFGINGTKPYFIG